MRNLALSLLILAIATFAHAADGNRLAYLDNGCDPYYVHRDFPKLTTPMWAGEEGVEAVVILGIDDMRGHERWEAYLRPILERLKKIDGRAPVSIMTCTIDPKHEHLQKWLKEGLSLECHTIDHPCPILAKGDFKAAKSTYDRCVDLMNEIPNNRPVAFRTPCCDSLNTNSPRMYAEIFNKTTPLAPLGRGDGGEGSTPAKGKPLTPNPSPQGGEGSKRGSPQGGEAGREGAGGRRGGNFLTIDSSVFNVFTSDDPALPKELVLEGGQERFKKYLPRDRNFVNVIENYPYPYVIDKLCWEFPCVTPSDWQAQHLHKPNNPLTIRDWQAALDCTVIKQGVFCLVFHPHNWIKPEQVNDFIDYAVAKHGKKVKFLTFKEAEERLNKNLLGGQPLRDLRGGDGHRICLLDMNSDGGIDLVKGDPGPPQSRIWNSETKSWTAVSFPTLPVVLGLGNYGALFGRIESNRTVSFLFQTPFSAGAWTFDGTKWVENKNLLSGLQVNGRPVATAGPGGAELGARLRDLNGDGQCELVTAEGTFVWSNDKKSWARLSFPLPVPLVDNEGWDHGFRFLDLNGDNQLDIVFSNEERWGIYLFESMEKGWSKKIAEGTRDPNRPPGGRLGVELPPITIKEINNGFFVRNRTLFWQNENTAHLKDLVAKVTFDEILKDVQPGPKKPAESLKCIKVRPGFTVEQMATEPQVQSPVAMAFGPDGKLWVVEMGDYPTGADGKGSPGGRVKFLEDTTGAGKYDKATVFLDGLSIPTGVLPWRKGVLVTCAPDIFYAEDTDGDGKADKREVLFTGFTKGNPQHRVNTLAWGLDNWIYCANGDSGGKVVTPTVSPPRKQGAIDIRGRDFRIRPDTGEIEAITGQTQFGRSRDDWGNWFGGNNSDPMWHFVLDDHYLRRNPHFAPPNPRVQVSVQPGVAPVYPISRLLPRFNDYHTANRFTSACSPMVYRDELFGPEFVNNTFVSEPVHNLIHREIMTAKGVTFTSQRAPDEQQSEFLASTDNWFRPTTIITGPDGALWFTDTYRHVIEHPEWIPKDWQARLDLRAGHDMGRIYRVYPGEKKPRTMPRLDKLDTAGLVAALDSPNGWQRDTAQMMLLWRNDKTAVPLLERMARISQQPLARLQALCTLDGLNELRGNTVNVALKDPHPGVRRHAIRLTESVIRSPTVVDVLEIYRLRRLEDDPDPQVRMQLAYTLGQFRQNNWAGRSLGQLALSSAGDRHLLAAVMSSVHAENVNDVMETVLANPDRQPPEGVIDNLLRIANALGNNKATVAMLRATATKRGDAYSPWQFTTLAHFLDSLAQRGSSLAQLARDGDEELRAAVQQLQGLYAAARWTVAQDGVDDEQRLLAIRLLGRGLDQQEEDLARLTSLLVPQSPSALQAAAIDALGNVGDPQVTTALLKHWRSYPPALRSRTLGVLLRRPEWTQALLDAIESKTILAVDVDAVHQQRLTEHKTAAIRLRAANLFAGSIDADRVKLVDSYRPALATQGDPAKGREHFAKTCAACHKLGGVGNDVGPDLAALTDRSPEFLLVAILDPNRAVEARYLNYVAQTKNGLTLAGVLTQETGNSVTLVGVDGKPVTILRTDLEQLASTGKSAMPDGVEKDLPPAAMADLLAYLASVRSTNPGLNTPKSFPLNKPALITVSTDGALRLPATHAEIYGPAIVLEEKYHNLGFWQHVEDRAVWTVEVPKAGKYVVSLDYACDPSVAGNTLELRCDEGRITWPVVATRDWDSYQHVKIGELTLSAGRQRITCRSAGPIKGALIDLRSVRLAPQ